MSLKISVRSALPSHQKGDIIVVGVVAGDADSKKRDRPMLDDFDRTLGGALDRLLKKEEFTGKKDQQVSIALSGRIKADRLVVIGLGDMEKLGVADVRTFAAKAARAANGDKARRLVLGLPAGLESHLRAIAEGLELGAYRFTKYMTGDRKPKVELAQVDVCLVGTTGTKGIPNDAHAHVTLGQSTALGVNLARDLSNEPANVIYPDTLAEAAIKIGKEAGIKVQIFNYDEIQKRGMKLLQAVGQGSEHKPCFGHMSWKPAGAKRRIVVVGKGITFDSGGLSIKPSAGMGEMKHDMSGAANVIGMMATIGRLKPNVEVHGIFAAAENMPDGSACRPGDVWGSLDGKSVEITNTDAEGRLILADALAYARVLEPDWLIDNATLTGAAVVALGNGCSGWYASNDAAAEEFQLAVNGSGEQMWRMPLLDDLKDQLKSDSADLKNSGDRWGGSISAALFLREFVGNVANWIHCDIAGPAMGDRVRGWDPKGGTGHGVLTFLHLIERAEQAAAGANHPGAPDSKRSEKAPKKTEKPKKTPKTDKSSFRKKKSPRKRK
ncbi:MAG: leucyl aminopeptidase [Polyangiaceae bacterium]|nr:leucyl aminopeptidase [Polyangiaceae bacterium]